MRVRVDDQACVGHGRCYEIAPAVFSEDERGHCRIERESLSAEQVASARLAVANCPEGALELIEAENEA